MALASLHKFYVMTTKITPLELFYVMAEPMNYTETVGFPSGISWRAMDYMKIM